MVFPLGGPGSPRAGRGGVVWPRGERGPRGLLGPVAGVLHMGEEGPRGSTASFPRDSEIFADRRRYGDALPCAEGTRLHMGGFQRC